MRLQGKTALVTGASRGIGRAIAETFAVEGAKVALVYHSSQAAAEEVAQAIRATGGTAATFQQDVAQPDGAQELVQRVVADWGQLDILVNNAGVIRDKLVIQMPLEDWQAVIQTNLTGVFAFCKAAATVMMSKRTGSIINLSSVAAQHSNKGQGNYAASKAGIEALSRTLASEMASRGIRVNCIAPGFIETDMTTTVRNLAGDKIKAAIPLRRYGAPQDIAQAALFLASEQSAYITGQVLTVDGGLSLGGQV